MNRCVFPGTFDPMHQGHVSIVERAAKIFDEVIVAIAKSETKNPSLSLGERKKIAIEQCSHIKNASIETFDILLVDFVKQKRAKCVVKGLRNVEDFSYEMSMSAINRRLSQDFETLFLISDPDKLEISSSKIRELELFGVDVSKIQ